VVSNNTETKQFGIPAPLPDYAAIMLCGLLRVYWIHFQILSTAYAH